jgi:hypothetical protein
MSTALATMSDQLGGLTTFIGNDDEMADMNRSTFLPRIQFYAKGKSFGDGEFIPPGRYGVPQKDGSIRDLGKSIDVLPLAAKWKAMDFSDLEQIIATCDTSSTEYKRIKELSKHPDKEVRKHYSWGPAFLVFERESRCLYELFCGSNTLSEPGTLLIGLCPISAAECQRVGRTADEAHGPIPATLSSYKVANKKYNSEWFVSKVGNCSLPFSNLPSDAVLIEEIRKFLTVEREVDAVPEGEQPTRAH